MKTKISLIVFIMIHNLFAIQEMERYAILAGVNFGGTKRELLKYAHVDAQNMSAVLSEIGGIPDSNQIILLEPNAERFNQAIKDLSNRLNRSKTKNKREVILYFSGHANEKGLFFGNENYDYRILRKDIDSIPSDVKITVLDACASGAITRMKGGYRKQAFLVDASNNLSGYAFLTSSTNNEGSQESDLIGGSFFTHFLVSGMRGAADVSQDGIVTLGEAYQFAFNETLNRTQSTSGGTQHPSYDMKLSGSGDIVMSDLRKSNRSIIFGNDIVGRVYIKTGNDQLITEFYKNRGRSIELSLSDDIYHIVIENNEKWKKSSADLRENIRIIVDEKDFKSARIEKTRMRGLKSEKDRPTNNYQGDKITLGLLYDELMTGYVSLGYEWQKYYIKSYLGWDFKHDNTDELSISAGLGLGYMAWLSNHRIHFELSQFIINRDQPNSTVDYYSTTNGVPEQTSFDLMTRMNAGTELGINQYLYLRAGVSLNILENLNNSTNVYPWNYGYGTWFNPIDGIYIWPGAHVGLNVRF